MSWPCVQRSSALELAQPETLPSSQPTVLPAAPLPAMASPAPPAPPLLPTTAGAQAPALQAAPSALQTAPACHVPSGPQSSGTLPSAPPQRTAPTLHSTQAPRRQKGVGAAHAAPSSQVPCSEQRVGMANPDGEQARASGWQIEVAASSFDRAGGVPAEAALSRTSDMPCGRSELTASDSSG
jgi:hypothetical protein